MNHVIETPLQIIKHLISGGECQHIKHKYFIVYKNGTFIVKDTGTLVGDFNNYIRIYNENSSNI